MVYHGYLCMICIKTLEEALLQPSIAIQPYTPAQQGMLPHVDYI